MIIRFPRSVVAMAGLVVLLLPSISKAVSNSTDLNRDYIVEHNIFSPERKYTPEKQSSSKVVANGAIKLVGIIMAGDLKEAVISIKGANPPVMILKEGEEANGCKVVSVTSKEVVVERGGKKETLVFEEDKGSYAQTSAGKEGSKNPNSSSEKGGSESSPTEGVNNNRVKENPFFKILESVRKNAGKRGDKKPPPIFPFH